MRADSLHRPFRLETVETTLARGLSGRLPGRPAQFRMAPRPRPEGPDEDHRPAAALVLVYPCEGRPHLLLTRRGGHLARHAGQISLPGGAIEPNEAFGQAALREAQEEVGVAPPDVRLLGALSPLEIAVSRFVIHPLVAIAQVRPDFKPDPNEVAGLLEVPIETLADPARLAVECWRRDERSYDVPLFMLDEDKVWGATAMILAEFLAVLGFPPDPFGAR